MGVAIRYMGTKRQLASTVAQIIRDLQPGACVDLFSGMCSVAGGLAASRRETWCNDVQQYAALIAQALVASIEPPPAPAEVGARLASDFTTNLDALHGRFRAELIEEAIALACDTPDEYRAVMEKSRHVGNDSERAAEAARLRTRTSDFPYCLATIIFADGYFGRRQAMEIDSLRYAIDRSRSTGALSHDEARWCLVALLQAASCLNNGPGHFAQFLRPRDERTYHRIRRLRRRSIWNQFHRELARMAPYGTALWRGRNRVYSTDAALLCQTLNSDGLRPAVAYADPPYSDAQYSRHYHVLETLTLYDYPRASGVGRYRPDRFQTSFSKLSTVVRAFEQLVAGVASLGAALVLSYPSNGLLFAVGYDPQSLLAQHYPSVKIVTSLYQPHSTLGAASGHATSRVEERVYLATGA